MSALPNDWVEEMLGNLATISSSKRIFHSDYVESGIPFYRSKEVIEKQKGNDISTELYITQEKFDSIKNKFGSPEKNDLLLTSVGTLGVPYLVKENEVFYFKDGNLTWFREYQELAPLYLYYFFLSSTGKERLNEITIGSTQSALTIAGLKTIPINLPPLPEQKYIANILSSFDEKIELLREQNETLETLAQTIFKDWFVNFNYPDTTGEMVGSEFGEVPKGWHRRRLGDVLVIKRGGSPRPIKDYISDSGYRWLKISDASASNSPFIFEIKEHIKVEGLKKTTLLKKGALVLSNSATPGIPKFLEVDSCIHDGWLHFPNTDIFSYQYLYLFFKHIREPLLQQGNGSVFKNLKTDILKDWNMVIPDNDTAHKFDELIKPIFEKIKNNASQIQTLTKTRDTLLPKLMSGEVRANS